jgi:hypothetical protein
MDSIDITDSAFSLGIPDVNDVISTGGELNDYTMFIYIGVAILIAFIGMFVYKIYINKQVSDNDQLDCPGGFCTMENRPNSNSHI